ncbi:MAG: tetratricopeptide repeat protein, partial [Anaerolineaceae bacterium]|nr:tetratricopeptide repeat protein [Anaerolineaceae bacterium]
TLRAAVDWSYDLLDDAERALFRQLSVFAGGFTLDAVRDWRLVRSAQPIQNQIEGNEVEGGATTDAAPPSPGDQLDLLTRLVDKSLLTVEPVEAEMRYGLLETMRQYGREKLVEAGEETGARRQHLRWFSRLAEQAEPHLLGANQMVWLKRLDVEYDNISAALHWAAGGHREDIEAGLRLGGALWRYWDRRGYLAETRQRLGRLLAHPAAQSSAAARAKALYSVGIATHLQSDDAAANSLFMESLAIWQTLGEAGKLGAARAAHAIAFMGLRRADYANAHLWYAQCLSRYRQVNDQWGLAEAMSQLGTMALREGDAAKARTLQEEALALKQTLGDWRGIRFSVWALGNIARLQADYATARACYVQALTTAQEMDDKWSLPYCIEAFGYLAVAQDQPHRAAMIFAAADDLRRATGAPLPAVWQADYDRALTAIRTRLGQTGFQAAWAKGAALRLSQTITFALTGQGDKDLTDF